MININIDSDGLNGAMLDVVDCLTVSALKEARDGLINNYENAKSGNGHNVFVVGDAEADASEIRRRIEAFDMVLDYFSIDHEPYDFDQDK